MVKGEHERAALPNRLASATHHALGIEPTVVQRMQDLAAAGQRLSAPVAVALMQELYRALVNDQAHRFAELFEHLLASDSPLVFTRDLKDDAPAFIDDLAERVTWPGNDAPAVCLLDAAFDVDKEGFLVVREPA
jgi:hypothetical protein